MWPRLDDERVETETDVSIEDIKRFFRNHNTGPYFSMFETGLNGVRFDLIRIDPYRRYVRIFEFKSSRKDFKSDKKWEKYIRYCHTLTFVCPREVIRKEELPPGIGLMWVHKWKYKPPAMNLGWHLNHEWIKRPRKQKDVETETLLDIAFMMVYRTIWRKDAAF